MITFDNLYNNSNMKEVARKGNITVFEHERDLSTTHLNSMNEYYASKMNIRKRQVLIELKNQSVTISAGAMQWVAGQVSMVADVKGLKDFIGKTLSAGVTNESAIKPRYEGIGHVMLEPTYKHILIEEVSEWGGLVLEDGLFLACDSAIKQKISARSNISSALLGGAGLFNLSLTGKGIAVLESPVPREELILVKLDKDEIKIDGKLAIAWSESLNFTVEKSSKKLISSAVSGEGFVNVYRGTGNLLLTPVDCSTAEPTPAPSPQ